MSNTFKPSNIKRFCSQKNNKMKKIIYSLIIGLILTNITINAQELKRVYSIVKELQTDEWYLTQKKLWKKEIDKSKKNAVAWENYYNAARALKNLSWKDEELLTKYSKECATIAEQAYKAVPKSYQANLIMWRNSGNNEKYLKYLEKAYELNPNNEEVLVNMLTQAKLMANETAYSKHCKEYYKTNDISSGLLNWGYNLLSELDDKAIVFTSGDNDTYPLLLMQEAKNYRKDVTVLNTYLLFKDDYRNSVIKKLNLPELNIKLSESKTQEEYNENQQKIIDHFIKNYQHSVYVVTTSIDGFKEKYGEQFHLTGLAYKYSESPIDNISLIIRNYEKRYLLDYLKITFPFNIGEQVAENAQIMYLPALTKLYKHYKNTEQNEKLEKVKELLLLIGERTNSIEEVNSIIE